MGSPAFAQEQTPPSDGEPRPPTDEAKEKASGDASRDNVPEEAEPIPPRVNQSVEPTFPESALKQGVTEGSVTLKVRVRVDGSVQETTVVESTQADFDEAAREAALQYVFDPAVVRGKPTAASILLRIDFRAPPQAEPSSPVDGKIVAAPPPTTAAPPVALAQESTAPPNVAVPPPFATAESDPAAADALAPVNVTVQGHSEAERLRRSAEAVQVVDTKEAKRRSQDLGEVLARTQGVAVQRSSGLGSETRISLNGLTDDQIRFFLDGVPLEFMGYPLGIANVPVNLVDQIEIYRGVVPIRFGADALGGAINLESDHNVQPGAHGAASFQAGSFGTYRTTVNGHYLEKPTGWLTRVAAFLDVAENDYPMDIQVPDSSGQEVDARVYRFHDAYQARGINAEAGFVNKPWAKRLTVKGFVSDHDKEIQHNPLMTFNPYGDVEYGQTTAGAVVRYDNVFLKQLELNTVAGYAYEQTSYDDFGECVYDWFGQCIRDRVQPGERVGRAQEQDYWEHNLYGRVNLEWLARPEHSFHLSVSPTYTERSGTEHRLANPEARDPLSAERKLGGVVTGIAYHAQFLEKRLENQLFFKDYFQALRSEDPMSNGKDFRRQDRTTHRVGFGDSLRHTFLEWLYAKASYEWATRLPRADEIFGNAFPVSPNLYLKPESSHNVNLGVTVDSLSTSIGELRADVNGFLRDVHDLIRIVGNDDFASYQNVQDARSLGVETALGWTSVGKYVALDGNATYVDFRNTSQDGPDAAYEGDRIPNRPYFFATGSARFQLSDVATPQDEISLTWTSRYVHSFLRGWESIGIDKPVVPEQLLHSLDLTYFVQGDRSRE